MKPYLMALRVAGSLALLLGLTYLFGVQLPFRTVDIHMLLGIVAVVSAAVVGWQLRSTTPGMVGASLAVAVLVVGIGLRLRVLEGTAIGLMHLALAVAMVAFIEVATARARRTAVAVAP